MKSRIVSTRSSCWRGYRDRRHWQEPFIQHGRQLRWEEGMARFVDRTGRPGPATWEAGDNPGRREDDPVSGLSWYEAAAYARFPRQVAPATIYHWYKASERRGVPGLCRTAISASGYNAQERRRANTDARHVAVATFVSGAVTRAARGSALGGGWNDVEYMFHRPFALSPGTVSLINACALVRALATLRIRPAAHRSQFRIVTSPWRNQSAMRSSFYRAFVRVRSHALATEGGDRLDGTRLDR